jgi:hypothetical protein
MCHTCTPASLLSPYSTLTPEQTNSLLYSFLSIYIYFKFYYLIFFHGSITQLYLDTEHRTLLFIYYIKMNHLRGEQHRNKTQHAVTAAAAANISRSSASSSASVCSLRSLLYAKKWDEAALKITTDPHEANLQDKMGDLPLHEVCHQGAPFHVIQKLIHANKPAVKKKGFCGRLPLHYAAYSKPSVNVIKLLLRHYPDGAKELDMDGRLPLHLAVVRNAPKQSMQALIEANPKALSTPNAFGNTPIMLARNEHVANLLMEEASRPRGVEKGMQLEKKLLRGVWTDEKRRPLEEKRKVSLTNSNNTRQSVKMTNRSINGNSSPAMSGSDKRRSVMAAAQKSTPRENVGTRLTNSPRSPLEIMAKGGERKSIPSPDYGSRNVGGFHQVMSNYRKVYIPSPTRI